MALLSVQEGAADRPVMSEFVSMLSDEVANLPSPKQPIFLCENYGKFNSTANMQVKAS